VCSSKNLLFVAGEVLVVVIGLLLLATLPLALGWKRGPSQPSFTVPAPGSFIFFFAFVVSLGNSPCGFSTSHRQCSHHLKMSNEVKLYALGGSPFVCRVKIALSMKGIKYENIEENMRNKSEDLLKYNPVHKKVPVLVHNGNPISESLVIIEYLDDVWKGVPILPQDPYEKAVARFWAKFIDDKVNYLY
ncbi:probable glutathione S-transferase, partial [Tanacetum coccineum]